MTLNLRLFGLKVRKYLASQITLMRKPISDYSQYLSSEFSRTRMTHDTFDNHYYVDFAKVSNYDFYGMTCDDTSKSRSR